MFAIQLEFVILTNWSSPIYNDPACSIRELLVNSIGVEKFITELVFNTIGPLILVLLNSTDLEQSDT